MMILKKTWAITVVFLLCIFAFSSPIQATILHLAQARVPISQNAYAVARATTVLIGRDLSKGQVESAEEAKDAGSGVIIARELNRASSLAKRDPKIRSLYRYWVITNAHVVDLVDTRYGIRTADGAVHPEGGISGDTLKESEKIFEHIPQIYRFGQSCDNANLIDQDCFRGTDLAVLTFYNDKKYPTVALADVSSALSEPILVSGWPQSSAKGKRVRRNLIGEIKQVIPVGQIPGNYTLETTIRGKQGISGGHVFNRDGGLIGIYGKGQGEKDPIGSGDNYAIDIGQFIQLQSTKAPGEKQGYLAAFTPSAPRLELSTAREENILKFAKQHEDTGDNMTKAERKNLYFADLLPDDPRWQAFGSLETRYGCWAKFSDGTTGGGLQERRGEFVRDLNTCFDRVNELIAAATADMATVASLKELQGKLEALNQRVAKLKAIGSTSSPSRTGRSSSSLSGSLIPTQ
ncbi:trypsin-like peptidase domain-containing protein [Leptolyngbya sp. AN03gr2]|uniref:S1 family peptidase n=1 Tax=unclassified Leptolyngbya TaxID=2650499 RepID=UPI003D30F2A6